MVEDRRTLGTAESIEEAERLFIEDFDTWDMTRYYLYSKLLRSGVSGHIGTGGWRPWIYLVTDSNPPKLGIRDSRGLFNNLSLALYSDALE